MQRAGAVGGPQVSEPNDAVRSGTARVTSWWPGGRRGVSEHDNGPSGRGGVRRMDVTAQAQADSQPSQASDGAAQPAGGGRATPADLIAVALPDAGRGPARRPGAAAVGRVRAAGRVHDRPRTWPRSSSYGHAGRRDAVADPGDAGRPPGRGARRRRAASLLADPEGTPLAVLEITERSEVRRRPTDAAGRAGPAGRPGDRLREPEHGPFRRLMLTPAEAKRAGSATARCWPSPPAARCTAGRSASSGTWPASSRRGCCCCR